jgi:hypothetical protein
VVAADTPSSEVGINLARDVREFCLSVSISYLKNSLTCRKMSRHGTDGFTSPLKEVVLRISIALKNASLSGGFEPANLGSNGKYVNHYITENDSETSLHLI